tara:strand:- start:769 stop:969 length:201 start_codon:yes stop_codon:yes gene_type:complete
MGNDDLIALAEKTGGVFIDAEEVPRIYLTPEMRIDRENCERAQRESNPLGHTWGPFYCPYAENNRI